MIRISERRRPWRSSRGQSLVELALVLPVLFLFMLIVLDFGRIYLGYINLQNLARIAANYAANDADAWSSGDTASQAEYRSIVLNDAAATNCDLPGDVVPAPAFTDRNGDGDAVDIGDLAEVSLSCDFDVWTPVISGILGETIEVSASAVFPIKTGQIGSGGGGGGLVPQAAFTADDTTGAPPHTVQFTDESGGSPTSWAWNFGDGVGTSTLRDPTYTYSNPGVYSVTLTVSNSAGTGAPLTKTNYISVSTPGVYDFTSDTTTGPRPLTVQFTDLSTGGPTAWLWSFGDGQTSTLQNPTNTYTTAGTYTVTLDVTTPTGSGTVTKTNYINVEVGACLVPDFVGTKRNDAQTLWASRGFTTTVQDAAGAPNGNYTIGFQSLTGNSTVPCNAVVQVNQ